MGKAVRFLLLALTLPQNASALATVVRPTFVAPAAALPVGLAALSPLPLGLSPLSGLDLTPPPQALPPNAAENPAVLSLSAAPPTLPASALPAAAPSEPPLSFDPGPAAVSARAPEAPPALKPRPNADASRKSLDALADGLSKDAAPGGARAQAASSAFFDGFVSLPDSQLLPHAEGASIIAREIDEPPELLRAKGIQATVVVYGSARIPSAEIARTALELALQRHGRKPATPEGRAALKAAKRAVAASRYYELARRLGSLVARAGRGRIAIVTGGGPGIMEGANRGAFEAGGPSVGFNINLPFEQDPNPYITPGLSVDFDYFASRKVNLRHGALGMVYFPGGFGTMDELFEVLTLMQTGKMAKRPIVLIGKKSYWDRVLNFKSFLRMGLISREDLSLFRFAETAEEAWAHLSSSVR